MIINFDYLHMATGNDPELEKELFLVFHQSAAEAISDLKNAQDDHDVFKKRMHKIKGSAANLGMEDLSAIAKKSENSVTESIEQRAQCIADVEKAFEDVFDYLMEEGLLSEEEIDSADDPMRGL